MKKVFYAVLMTALVSLTACHKDLWNAIDGLDVRVTKLEELCKEMNTNISSLQTIVNVIQTNDFITSITEIKKGNDVIGYTITFGQHNPITIYNGVDGKDGQNGTNGKDGHTPIISVAQDVDGVYYWKLDGEWLLDDNGQKIRVTGKDGQNGTNGKDGQNGIDGRDGQDGQDGADGKDGQDGKDGADGQDGIDGQDGQDGITPQLKIENDYWYISYDNGATWTQLGKATGANGKDGQDGKDGKDGADGQDGADGDSMFKSVTQDDNYVYFTLADGSVIKIAKNKDTAGNIIIEDGAIKAAFSVSETKKVYFSQGNLQYNAALGTHLCADGTTKQGTWRFADSQWLCEMGNNSNASKTYNGWIDLFGIGTSGYNDIPPYDLAENISRIYALSYYKGNTSIANTYYDWGKYNAISNGGNQPNLWRTLTIEEWEYLINNRPQADALHFKAIVSGNEGLVFLPDNWDFDSKVTYYLKGNEYDYFSENTFSAEEWYTLEKNGAIFLPAGVPNYNSYGKRVEIGYWASSQKEGEYYYLHQSFSLLYSPRGTSTTTNYVYSVRLAKDVE